MSHQAKWFRQAAQQLNLLYFHQLDLYIPRLQSVIESVLPNQVTIAREKRLDLSHPATWWELVYTDAILRIEDQQGKTFRVAVKIVISERHAQSIYTKLKTPEFILLREKLVIARHWIFIVSKDDPHSTAQWTDILYSHADRAGIVVLGNLVE